MGHRDGRVHPPCAAQGLYPTQLLQCLPHFSLLLATRSQSNWHDLDQPAPLPPAPLYFRTSPLPTIPCSLRQNDVSATTAPVAAARSGDKASGPRRNGGHHIHPFPKQCVKSVQKVAAEGI